MWIEPPIEPIAVDEVEEQDEDPEWDIDDWRDYADCLRHDGY